MWTFESNTLHRGWMLSQQRFDTAREAVAAASEWLLVNVQNGIYRSDCEVRLVAAPDVQSGTEISHR